MMRKLLPILVVSGVFLGSAGESFSLPECVGSPTSNPLRVKGYFFSSGWSHCVGTYTDAKGNKVAVLLKGINSVVKCYSPSF